MTDFLAQSLVATNAQDAYRLLMAACWDQPANPDVWYRMGVLLNDVKKHAAAAAAFRRSDVLRSGDERTLTNLGWSLHLAERSEEAYEPLFRATEMGSALAPTNLAQVAGLRGSQSTAIDLARLGLSRSGGSTISHMALAFQLFFARQWTEGFREYEHRFAYRMPDVLSFPYPLWRGEKVDRLFVMAEQGLGDTIFGLRWLLDLPQWGIEHVMFHTHKELLSLVRERREFARWHIEAIPAPLPRADAWIGLLSLPVAMGVTDWNAGKPYVDPPPPEPFVSDGVMRSDVRVPPGMIQTPTRRVGICWAGGELADEHWLKNIGLPDMLRVCEVPGLEIHALQVGPHKADIGECGAHGLVRDRAPEISDMRDTVRILAGLDLVLTVDTALAHLAGAMGKPTWLLLNSRGGDGRWGRTGEATNWYPTTRVFRKALDEPWAAVLDRVCDELRRS